MRTSTANSVVSKIRERTQDETLKQERCTRREAWDLANDVFKLKKEESDALHSPAEAWVMPAPSSRKPEEREFEIDSRASMHMLSKKVLSSAEMETLRRSRTPTTVVTANGVRTKEEAQACVHDLHLFVTVQVLDDTPAVLSLGKLCEEHGYTCEWAGGQNPHLTKDGGEILCKTENFVLLVVLGLSSSSTTSSSSTSSPQGSSRLLTPANSRSNEGAPENWRKEAAGNSL